MNKIILKEYIDEISMGPFGSNIKVDNFIDNGIPVLNGSNLTQKKLVEDSFKYISEEKANSLKKANAKRGDVVITHRGTLGQVSFIPEDSLYQRYVISQSQFRVKFNEKINPIYFTYLMHTAYGQQKLFSFKNHVGVPALAQATTNFKNLEILIHDRNSQDKIISVLRALDTKIELNNKINAELEAMAKLIYDYWFVQFDFPFDFKQNKVADESSNFKDVKPYKSSGGKMVYNEELKREIPEGWEVGTMKDYIKIGSGYSFQSKNYLTKGRYRIITIKNVQDGYMDLSKTDFVNEIPNDLADFCLLKKGDVLMSLTGNVGRMCLVHNESSLLNQRVGKLIGDKIYIHYIYLLLNRPEEKIKSEKIATGSSQKNLSPIDVVKRHFILPPKDCLSKFNLITHPMYNQIINNKVENQQLSELRDWLLPMLMNGQVKVKGAYEKMEEVGMAAEGDVGYESSHTLSIPPNKKGFAKLVLAGKIIKECKDNKEFTNIKFQKLQHLAEHLMEADLNLNYYNQAAGPYDNRFMHTLHKRMKQQKWFDSYGYKYSSMEKNKEIDGFFNGYFSAKNEQFTKLIKLLGKATENQCEIISTLYAIWNDRIIKGEPIENELLIEDFLNWSKLKQKYTENQLHDAIQWMKDKQIEPKGFGKLIKHAKKRKS